MTDKNHKKRRKKRKINDYIFAMGLHSEKKD